MSDISNNSIRKFLIRESLFAVSNTVSINGLHQTLIDVAHQALIDAVNKV